MIENGKIGKIAVFLVGATCVGSVHLTANKFNYYEKEKSWDIFPLEALLLLLFSSQKKFSWIKNF